MEVDLEKGLIGPKTSQRPVTDTIVPRDEKRDERESPRGVFAAEDEQFDKENHQEDEVKVTIRDADEYRGSCEAAQRDSEIPHQEAQNTAAEAIGRSTESRASRLSSIAKTVALDMPDAPGIDIGPARISEYNARMKKLMSTVLAKPHRQENDEPSVERTERGVRKALERLHQLNLGNAKLSLLRIYVRSAENNFDSFYEDRHEVQKHITRYGMRLLTSYSRDVHALALTVTSDRHG